MTLSLHQKATVGVYVGPRQIKTFPPIEDSSLQVLRVPRPRGLNGLAVEQHETVASTRSQTYPALPTSVRSRAHQAT